MSNGIESIRDGGVPIKTYEKFLTLKPWSILSSSLRLWLHPPSNLHRVHIHIEVSKTSSLLINNDSVILSWYLIIMILSWLSWWYSWQSKPCCYTTGLKLTAFTAGSLLCDTTESTPLLTRLFGQRVHHHHHRHHQKNEEYFKDLFSYLVALCVQERWKSTSE